MRVLILRTFAHSRVWEQERNKCEFEDSQLTNMINSWEPDFKSYKVDDISFALGIYTDKYFRFIDIYGNRSFQNTIEENSISLLETRGNIDNYFSYYDDEKQKMYVKYFFVKKLWKTNDNSLMLKIDGQLIEAKKQELLTILIKHLKQCTSGPYHLLLRTLQ